MQKIEVGGKEYTVNGNPDMRTVKYVQEMEIQMMRNFIDDDDLLKLEQAEGEEDILENVLEDADIDDLIEMLWERSTQEPLQTICLGTNTKLSMDDLMDMGAKDFGQLREACEEELGGSATDFINSLGIDIGSTERIAQAVQDESSEYSGETPPAVSNLSNKQSEETGATQPTKST